MLELPFIDQGGTAGEGGGEVTGAAGDRLEQGDARPTRGRGRLRPPQEAVDRQQLEGAVEGIKRSQAPGKAGENTAELAKPF